jgi:hypothetical protein
MVKKKTELTIVKLDGSKTVRKYKVEPTIVEPPAKDIVTCDCGVLIDLDKAKKQQWDWNKVKQEVCCPVCKDRLWREND